MNKVRHIFKILLIIFGFLIYGFLVFGYMNLLFHKKDQSILYFWLISLLVNMVCIIINILKHNKTFIFFIFSFIFLNFFVLFVLNLFMITKNFFQYTSQVNRINNWGLCLLVASVIVFTGNWLLPFLYYFGFRGIMQKERNVN
jgi:hypothetical protein